MQLDLFNSSGNNDLANCQKTKRDSINNTLESFFDQQFLLYPSWLNHDNAKRLLDELYASIRWQEEWISMYGKQVLCPRLTYWMGDNSARYEYSNIMHQPNSWHPEVESIKNTIQRQFKASLNSCLLNLYRNQNDSVSWHQDNEPELGCEPLIASLSLGESRVFEIKNIQSKKKFKLQLRHGDLLIMQKGSQSNWLHQLPKSDHVCSSRINLTFRFIEPKV
jgi:alkylated DNA repair dioxygenase AlkB